MEDILLDIEMNSTPLPRKGDGGEVEEYIINMGPQHPSTHGVLRFEVCLQGEQIKYLRPHCGYIHRGIEKMSEALTYPQLATNNNFTNTLRVT